MSTVCIVKKPVNKFLPSNERLVTYNFKSVVSSRPREGRLVVTLPVIIVCTMRALCTDVSFIMT